MADQPPDLHITRDDLTRLQSKMAAIPRDKSGAFIAGIDWRGGVPVSARFGVATRIGEHLQLSAEAEERFKKGPPNADFYIAWTW